MEILQGFIIGIVGSFHCLGMCGPIALAVPPTSQSKLGQLGDSFLINTGRITTYAIMGIIPGFLGSTINMAGYQEFLSIATGVLLLVFVFIPKKWTNTIPLPGFTLIAKFVKKHFHKMINSQSKASLFGLGLLNGLLPCGLVYIALAGSLATGSVIGGVFFMLFFGLGTFPMMVSVFYFKNIISGAVRQKINKLIPVGVAVVAVILILRGLALGIPYISPPPQATQINIEAEGKCCH